MFHTVRVPAEIHKYMFSFNYIVSTLRDVICAQDMYVVRVQCTYQNQCECTNTLLVFTEHVIVLC